MNVKTKITLIIWAIIAFLGWWVILVMSLIDKWNNLQADLIQKAPIQQKIKKQEKNTKNNSKNTENKENNNNPTNPTNNTETNNKQKKENNLSINKINHTLTILTYKNLVSEKAWKLFAYKYKKLTSGNLKLKFKNNLKQFNKDLIYSLATKDSSFDIAIIPEYWFQDIEEFSKWWFKINWDMQLESIFDYTFEKYIKDNHIKAIPFAIEPIIWYTFDKKANTNQDFNTWKNLIINSPDRLDTNWNLKTMPLLLWYDKLYIKLLEKWKSFFPVFDVILRYYVFKKSEQWIKLLKDFWQNPIYKTFDLRLYYILSKKYKKYDFCKNNIKYCLLADKKSILVYWFSSDLSFFNKNKLNLFKKFKANYKKLKLTNLALANKFAEYPVRDWIIIVNPNSKNIQYIGTFIKSYIKLGQNNKLPFYKNLISPFSSNPISKELSILSNYKWRFISLDNMWIKEKNILTKKIINYLAGKININLLLTN